MIEAIDLGKTFDDFVAVKGIDLTVGQGELLALLGPNGAGKTTTVRMLSAILRPSKGKAIVAIMRKLAKSLWYVARGEPFDPQRLFNIRALKGAF